MLSQNFSYRLFAIFALVSAVTVLAGQAYCQAPIPLGQDLAKPIVTPQIGHSQTIHAVAFSPDGRFVVSGGWDTNVKLWEVSTGRLIRTFQGHTGSVDSVTFSPDGRRIVTAGYSSGTKLWETDTGRLVRSFEQSDAFSAVFSDDGKFIISGGWRLKVWDAISGDLVTTLKGYEDRDDEYGYDGLITSVGISRDGRRIAAGGSDHGIVVWDVETGRRLIRIDGGRGEWSGRVTSVSFSPDGQEILSIRTNELKIWNVRTGSLVRSFEGGLVKPGYSAKLSSDGRFVISGGWEASTLWDAATGKVVRTFPLYRSQHVQAVVFSPDGRFVLSAGETAIGLWTVNGSFVRNFEGSSLPETAIALSSDGQILASGGGGKLKLWETATGRLTKVIDEQWVRSLAFSPDGKFLVSAEAGATKLRESHSGRLVKEFRVGANEVTFSYDGELILAGLRLVNRTSGEIVRTISGIEYEIKSSKFSADGKFVVAGADSRMTAQPNEHNLGVWEVATGKLVRSFEGEGVVALSPDNRLVAGANGYTVHLWSVDSGKPIQRFSHGGIIRSVIFSPDGKMLITAGGNGICFWDVSTGRKLKALTDHHGEVLSVAITASGNRIASAGQDGTLRVWDTSGGDLIATLASTSDNNWMSITPAGFFASSPDGAKALNVVRGLDTFSVTQFYQHLYRPDLVEAALKGDAEGNYRDNSWKLNLEKILEQGPSPQIDLVEQKTERAGNSIRVTVRITDSGGGIGSKIIWRVNGQRSGAIEPASLHKKSSVSAGRIAVLSETFNVKSGDVNVIEVVATNGAESIASVPFRITVDSFGVTTEERPKMYVLALGVDAYRMPEYRLSYAVSDAKDFANALKTLGAGLFANVNVKVLADNQVTEWAVADEFRRIARESKPNDVFVLFLAGHGKSIEGRYYYYPQTLDFTARHTVQQDAIGQDKWEKWLAMIDAQKKLLVIDTCESAAAGMLIRGNDLVRSTAMEQLQYATGNNLIAASRDAAHEGYKNHGVLTYALLEAFQASGSKKETVKVGWLADYVDERVPAITHQLLGVRQAPIRKLSGNDFPIGIKGEIASFSNAESISKIPTHVVIADNGTHVREMPSEDAKDVRPLKRGARVRVVSFTENWALVALEGKALGYVPVATLLKFDD